MNNYELTFLWPNGDWTWIHHPCADFHEAMLNALLNCPKECRVLRIERMPTVAEIARSSPFRLDDEAEERGSEG